MPKPFENKKVEELKKPVIKEVAKEAEKSQAKKEAEALERKVMADALDAKKAKEAVQIREVDKLQTTIKDLQAEIDRLVLEYNQKKKVNDNLGASIQSANNDLNNLKAKFEEKNAKLIAEYDKKLADVNEADGQYRQLLKEVNERAKKLAQDISVFEQEREQNRQQVHAMKSALDQNNAQWKVREADILEREAKLEEAKKEFEAYKESLQPEIARITSIKNENDLLLQKIEMDRQAMEQIRLASLREKDALEEARLVMQAQNNDHKIRIQNEEARLRKWEQDIKDSALELKAKQTQAEKILHRERLREEIERNSKQEVKSNG